MHIFIENVGNILKQTGFIKSPKPLYTTIRNLKCISPIVIYIIPLIPCFQTPS